jgi:hypothetical protein
MTATVNCPGPRARDVTGSGTSPGIACCTRCGNILHTQAVDRRVAWFTQPERGAAGG